MAQQGQEQEQEQRLRWEVGQGRHVLRRKKQKLLLALLLLVRERPPRRGMTERQEPREPQVPQKTAFQLRKEACL